MKTKYLLGTLVFPAVLGACTNDVFEQEQPNTVPVESPLLAGRTAGKAAVAVERADIEDPSTRIDGSIDAVNSIHWQWTSAEDKLGAVVVDYGVNDAIVSLNEYPHYAITNLAFAPKETPASSPVFTTPSAVVDGAYLFYSQYNGDITARRTINHAIPRLQKVKAGKVAGMQQIGSNVQEGGYNFFVSPIVDLGIADGSDVERALTMTSAHSILHITLTTDLESKYYANPATGQKGFEINKIVLHTLDDAGKFKLQLTLDPSAIANIQKQVAIENPTLPFKTNGAVIGEDPNVRAALSAVLAKLTDKSDKTSISNIGVNSADAQYNTTDLVYQLSTPYEFKSESDVMDLLVVMPAGVYNGVSELTSYQGKSEGALRMTVYTSEGTYDCYLGQGAGNKLIAHRAEKINISKKLIIKGGETNINLFDPNEGFNVETTEDWNYVIEYIDNHYRDFGNSSNWKTPVINLKAISGETINVDAAHYFPAYPVQYNGNVTLNLSCENQNYTINPKNVIFGAGTNRPTIKVTESSSTITLEGINSSAEGVDGTNVTKAIKLISDGKVVIPDDAAVDFELLESNQSFTAGKNATVNVNSAADVVLAGENSFGEGAKVNLTGASVTTSGTLALDKAAQMTVNSAYTNKAEATIAADAVATLRAASVNEGSFTVEVKGQLVNTTSTFTNATDATVTLKGATDTGINEADRSVAKFRTLVNNGTIDVEAGTQLKGTYGGELTVTSSITNNAAGKINVNGEFFANNATGKNYGVITLEENQYALIQLSGAKFSSLNDGYIYIAEPVEYEMFDSYYSRHNQLKDVVGDIITKLDAETLATVLAHHAQYAAQETAWSVINKIWAVDVLPFKTADTAGALANKNIVLKEGAGIKTSANATLNFNNIEVTADAALALAEGATSGTINVAGKVTINEGVTLTNAKGVKVVLPAGTYTATQSTAEKNAVLNIAGTLQNNGAINANAKNKSAIIATVSGSLVNGGTIGTAAKNPVYYSVADIKLYNEINAAMLNFKNTWRVREDASTLNATSTVLTNKQKTWALFVAWCNATPDSNGVWEYNNKKYKVDTDATNNQPIPQISAAAKAKLGDTALTDAATGKKLINTSGTSVAWSTTANTYVKAFGYIQDYLFIHTNMGTVDLSATGSKAYGLIYNGTKGTLRGEFDQNYKNREDELQ